MKEFFVSEGLLCCPDRRLAEEASRNQIPFTGNQRSGYLTDPWLSLSAVLSGAACTPEVIEFARERERVDELAHEILDSSESILTGTPHPAWGSLYTHQREGVAWLLRTGRAILADDMGLGKTRQSIIATSMVQRRFGLPAVVIAPANLLPNWQDELRMVGALDAKVESWGKVPDRIAPGTLLIVDEAHYGQSADSDRTQKLMRLARWCPWVICLTGTPMKNGRPKNIFPLLSVCRHPLGQDREAFETKFCGGHKRNRRVRLPHGREVKREFWWCDGATRLPELHDAIRPIFLRRMKDQCLDLPSKTRIMHPVPLSAELRKLYADAVVLAFAEYEARKEKKRKRCERWSERISAILRVAEHQGDDDMARRCNRALARLSGDLSAADAISILGIVRKAAAKAKVPEAIDLIERLVGSGRKVVVFSSFVDPVKEVAAHFGVRPFVGDEPNKDEVDLAFRTGTAPVFAATFACGGVGLNLIQAADVVLIDRPFTPGDAEQAEDRCNRIGQTRPVTAWWMQAFPIDYHVDRLLTTKQEIINSVLAGTGPAAAYIPGLRPLKLLEEILAGM